MNQANLTTAVRKPQSNIGIIDIQGDVTGFAENALMDAFSQASNGSTSAILLNFSGLDYMNSSGIGLLVTLLIRTQRQKQKLMACGLSAALRGNLQTHPPERSHRYLHRRGRCAGRTFIKYLIVYQGDQ